MLKIAVILFLGYLSIDIAKSQNNYEVTGLKVLNSTKDSLEIGWTLPSSSDYDKFEVSYIVVDTRANQTIDVSKDSTSFLVADLQPGSTLLFYVNTFKGGSSVASVYFSPTNKLDDVGNAKVISIGEVSVVIEFDLPKGYYSGIVIVCYPEDDSLTPELNNVGKGINQAACYFLTSGSTVTVAILVYKGDINSDDAAVSDGTFFRIRTLLSQSSISYCEISSSEVNVTLTAPSGYFDYLEFDLILLDTDSQLYYVDKSKTRPECAINRTITVGNLTADLIQNPIVISGLCPTSFWNGTVRTVRDGFDSVDSSLRYRNTYENVDCSLANLSTIGPITTFYWPNSEMKVDLYYVAIYLGSTNVTQATIPFGNNSWTVHGLENNKDYIFNISVRNSNKNITSMTCLKTLTTGDPCSKYDDNYEVEKHTAPYPDNIQLEIPNKIFTSTGYIKKLTVLVGTSSACENETQAGCYISTYIDVEDFYNGTNDPYIAFLPPVANCYNNKCSLKFVLDQNYYFSVMGDGPCGKIASTAAVFNVPSPFPLATIIGSVVGASVFLVLVLLGVIIVLTLKHIKKKHHEELSKLIDKPKYIYYEEPALTSF